MDPTLLRFRMVKVTAVVADRGCESWVVSLHLGKKKYAVHL